MHRDCCKIARVMEKDPRVSEERSLPQAEEQGRAAGTEKSMGSGSVQETTTVTEILFLGGLPSAKYRPRGQTCVSSANPHHRSARGFHCDPTA